MSVEDPIEHINVSLKEFLENVVNIVQLANQFGEELMELQTKFRNDTDISKVQLATKALQGQNNKNIENKILEEKFAKLKSLKEQESALRENIKELERKVEKLSASQGGKEKKVIKKFEDLRSCFKVTKMLTSTTFAYQDNPVAGFVKRNGELLPFEIDSSKMAAEDITEYVWKQIGGEVD